MKIFAQYINTKFIDSLSDISDEYIATASGRINNNLYEIHYKYNFDMYIFDADKLTNEIYQFVQDYDSTNTIIFYHHKIVNHNILNIPNKVKHISHAPNDVCTTIPFLVNEHVFNKQNTDVERSENILCFLDGYNSIPSELYSIVYPNTKIQLQLFSKTMSHQQNFGYLSEHDKAKILNESKYYLNIDNNYLIEAKLCGAEILSVSEDGKLVPFSENIPDYTTYRKFIESIYE